MSSLDFSKPITTRDGRPVRILCRDAKGDEPIIGLVSYDLYEVTERWGDNGRWHRSEDHRLDLINAPAARFRREAWVNVYPGPMECGVCLYDDREDADRSADPCRIACIKVIIEGTEGEGLRPEGLS